MLDTFFATPGDRRAFTEDIVRGRLTAFRFWPLGSRGSFAYDHLPVVPDQEGERLDPGEGVE